MNKNLLALVAVLVLGGAAAFLFFSGRLRSESGPDGSMVTQTETPKSLRDLFGLNVTQQCTFDDNEGNSGTVYIGSGKMRGDFSSANGEQTTVSHMIVDGQTSYIWMDGQTTGIKMTFESARDVDQTEQENQQGPKPQDVDEKVDYRCQPWVVNSSLFGLPAGITFSDFSSMMPTSPSGSGATGTDGYDKCSACDQVQGDAKVQCLSAMGCN